MYNTSERHPAPSMGGVVWWRVWVLVDNPHSSAHAEMLPPNHRRTLKYQYYHEKYIALIKICMFFFIMLDWSTSWYTIIQA